MEIARADYIFDCAILAQAKDLLPKLFVPGELPVFFLAQAVDGFEPDSLGGLDFRIRRHPPFDAERLLPFVRGGPAVK